MKCKYLYGGRKGLLFSCIRCAKKHKALNKKYKPYILKYKAHILKYMACIFWASFCQCMTKCHKIKFLSCERKNIAVEKFGTLIAFVIVVV